MDETLQATMSKIDKAVGIMGVEMKALKEEITKLHTRIDANKNDDACSKEILLAHDKRLDGHEYEINALTKSVTGILQELKEDRSNSNSKFESINMKLTDIQSRVESLNYLALKVDKLKDDMTLLYERVEEIEDAPTKRKAQTIDNAIKVFFDVLFKAMATFAVGALGYLLMQTLGGK